MVKANYALSNSAQDPQNLPTFVVGFHYFRGTIDQ